MDKRSLIALALIALVIVGGTMIQQRLSPPPVVADTSTSAAPSLVPPVRDTTTAAAAPTRPTLSATSTSAAKVGAIHPDTVTVSCAGRIAQFVAPGAVPVAITLPDYKDLKRRNGPLSIMPEHSHLLRYQIVNGADTINLDNVSFTANRSGTSTEFVATSPDIRVTYDMSPGHYLTHTTVTLRGAPQGAKLSIDLAPAPTS